MVTKTTLSTAGNVIVPAYLVLLQKGYLVTFNKKDEKEEWVAENNECRLIAEDMLTLLGLVNIFEVRGTPWKASDEEIDHFLKQFG